MEKVKKPSRMNRNIISVIIVAAIYSLNAFVLLPFIRMLSNDVIYAESLLIVILESFAEIIEASAVSVFYALMLTALYEKGNINKVFILFGALTSYKNFVTTGVLWLESGNIPRLWIWDIVDDLYFTALELVLMLIIFLISRNIIGRYNDESLVAQRVFKQTGEMPPFKEAYPFERFYDKTNCLLRSAFVCAVATFIAKIIGEAANDVLYIVSAGFPKEGITWIYMFVNYASKALFGVIVYLTVYVAMGAMLKKK